jgi:hypothetical protein
MYPPPHMTLMYPPPHTCQTQHALKFSLSKVEHVYSVYSKKLGGRIDCQKTAKSAQEEKKTAKVLKGLVT